MARSELKQGIKVLQSTFGILGLLAGFSNEALASGFQLWEQNVTSVENFHAGRAALAPDASIAYDNPAGITRIKHQQAVFGAMGIFTNVQYSGSLSNCVGTTCSFVTQGVAQGGSFSLIPDFHYVAPLSDNLGFGLSVVSPYGQDLEYGQSSFISSIVSRSRLQVIDIAPGLGFKVNTKWSFGLGLDIEKMSAELNVVTTGSPPLATAYPSITKGYDTAYGYHLGGLYTYSDATRAGLAYHSKVCHHLKGTSTWSGPGPSISGNPNPTRDLTNVYLPSDTTLSVYHSLNPKWALMGTIIYTQWSIIQNLIVQNSAGLSGKPIDYIMKFHNTFTYSVGADYIATEKLTLRAGAGYDQSPVQNAYRTLLLPDNNRYDLAVGGHYQAMKELGVDLGWTHAFFKNGNINPPLHPNFATQAATQGTTQISADVVGAQITWDFI